MLVIDDQCSRSWNSIHEASERNSEYSLTRIAKAGALIIYPSWPHDGYSARLHDLSPSGISMLTEYVACIGQTLKFNSDNLTGIACVISVQTNGASFLVHAPFRLVRDQDRRLRQRECLTHGQQILSLYAADDGD